MAVAPASGMVAAVGNLPVPDENGYYTMATDEEDGITAEYLASPRLSHGDGSAFPGYLESLKSTEATTDESEPAAGPPSAPEG